MRRNAATPSTFLDAQTFQMLNQLLPPGVGTGSDVSQIGEQHSADVGHAVAAKPAVAGPSS
jgi:hypothetical protein